MTRVIHVVVVAVLCVFGIVASASATTTHYWKGDNSTADSAGSATGTWSGTAAYAPGVLGQAFSFDGSDSFVDFGPDAGNFGLGDATVSFYVRSTRNDLVMGLLSKRPGCGNDTMWDMRADPNPFEGGTLFTEFDGSGGYNTLRLQGALADGAWHRVVFTRSGGTISLYRDGVLSGTSTMGVTDMQNAAELLLGWSPCTWADQTRPFEGSIDDVRIDDTVVVPYAFKGFFQPVDNDKLNVVQAGRAIPVKFSLGGNQGLSIFKTGYPASRPVSCDAGAGLDDIEQTMTAGGSSLSYDPVSQQYTYVWKTDKSWASSCRQLVVEFADGGVASATFQFKK